MKHLWRRIGLIRRIIILITCILVLPTALICLIYYQSYCQSLLSETEDELQSSLNALVHTMDSCLNDAEAVLDELDYSQELFYFLNPDSPAGREKTAGFLTELQAKWIDIRYAHPNSFYRLSLYTSNRHMESASSWKLYVHPFMEASGLPDADTAAFYYAAPRLESTGNDNKNFSIVESANRYLPVWLIVREFRTGQAVGAIELDISLEKLVGDRTLKEEYSHTAFLLTDSQGTVFYQTGALPQEISNGLFSENDSVQELTLDGETWLAASSRCSRTGMLRTALREKASVTESARQMLVSVSAAALIGIVLVMVLIALTIRRMLKRLMELDSAILQAGSGDLAVHIEEDDYHDEITRIKHSFRIMTIQLQELIRKTIEQEKAQKDAELKSLQAQINPHFLFNTLEAMQMQCEIDRYYSLENGLSSLGKLLRYTLNWESAAVPFRQEWDYLKNYISVMEIRWNEDFICGMDCDSGAERVMVPKMVLQPLVENSFQHGFREVPPPWKLEIRAELGENSLRVVIRDNGGGIPPDRLNELQTCLEQRRPPRRQAEHSHSIGLINVVQRIEHICPPGSGITIGNRSGQRGAEIILTIMQ